MFLLVIKRIKEVTKIIKPNINKNISYGRVIDEFPVSMLLMNLIEIDIIPHMIKIKEKIIEIMIINDFYLVFA